jgi:Domain of unknown function (DUF4173)
VRGAALAAGLAAAILLPGERLGIGVPIVACLVALAVALARPRPSFDPVSFGALALALAAMAAVRDAGWVVALDLAGAWLLGCAAAAGVGIGALGAPFARLRELPGLVPPAPGRLAPAARGVAIGAVVLIPFVALFWTADAAFAELGRGVPFPSGAELPGRFFAGVLVCLAALGLALAVRRPPAPWPWRPSRRLGLWEWAVPLALLDALFLVFVVVQLTVLFGGRDHVLRTAGLTYAEYARSGYWQLLTVAGLTLGVIAAAVGLAHVPRRRDRMLLRGLLGFLCALTLVVLASALRRLLLYEDEFGLTRARLFAEASALWVGGLFVLVALAGAVAAVRAHLARIAVTGTASALLAFSLANPDALIAERNVERWRETNRIDDLYLATLSADAAPVLVELPEPLREYALGRLSLDLRDERDPWSSFNLSRARARDVLADAGYDAG